MGMAEAAVGPGAVPSRAGNVEFLVSAVCIRCQLYVGKHKILANSSIPV